MSKTTTSRTAAEIRAAILNPERYAGPREPGEPLAVTQRQFGGEFVLWDARGRRNAPASAGATRWDLA